MEDINSAIIIAFQATQLILVFVTVLFLLRYPQIQNEIHSSTPRGDEEKKDLKDELWRSLWEKCFLLVLISGISFGLFSPLLLRVYNESSINLLNFDFVPTSFVFIALMILLFFLWSLTIQLYMRRRKIKIKDNGD